MRHPLATLTQLRLLGMAIHNQDILTTRVARLRTTMVHCNTTVMLRMQHNQSFTKGMLGPATDKHSKTAPTMILCRIS
jgi:hypothetical protein